MGKKSEYVIKFSNLKDGEHDFHFEIDNSFFEHFEYTDIEGANLALDMVLDKKPNMLVVSFNVKGSLTVMCDRCTDSVQIPVTGEDEIIYKFSDEPLDDEKIICIGSNEVEIDVTMPIYEFTSLLLPSKRIHPEGECNQEMLEAMDNYLMIESDEQNSNDDESGDDNEEIDPRWSQLKDLK